MADDREQLDAATELLDTSIEHLRQLLLVIDHADQHHEGQLSNYEGVRENARKFLAAVDGAYV